jgi:hypothetical protein
VPSYPPVEVNVGGLAASAANPLPIMLSTNGSAAGAANPISVAPAVIAQSMSASGTAAAPGAGTAFVSVANVPAGWYSIRVLFTITGAVETAAKNVRLSMTTGGTITDFPSGAGVNAVYSFTVDATLVANNLDTIKLTAIAAATASTVYTGTISLYRIA